MTKSRAKKKLDAIDKEHESQHAWSAAGVIAAVAISFIGSAIASVQSGGAVRVEYGLAITVATMLVIGIYQIGVELSQMNAYKRFELERRLEERNDPKE